MSEPDRVRIETINEFAALYSFLDNKKRKNLLLDFTKFIEHVAPIAKDVGPERMKSVKLNFVWVDDGNNDFLGTSVRITK